MNEIAHHTSVDLRYGDTDRQGHVNNAVFATLFESGRVDFLVAEKIDMPPVGRQFVIAEITIKYLAELHFPGRVDIATNITKLGNSSMHLSQTIHHTKKLVASATSVVVMIDEATRKSAPFDETTRQYLTRYLRA